MYVEQPDSEQRTKGIEPAVDGYLIDNPYVSIFNSSCTPVQMSTMAQARGVKAPNVDQPFRFGDFGCGQGVTLIVLAAAYPESEFVGLDLNPHHVATARRHARLAGLKNVEFFEGKIQNADPAQFGDLDFGIAHGVYSWVSADVRSALRHLLDATLKPDGLAFISYNTLEGYSQLLSVRSLLRSLAASLNGTTASPRQLAIQMMQELASADGPFFKKNPEASAIIKSWKTSDLDYLFHEYFNEDWHPATLSEVAAFMSKSAFSFCGDAMLPSAVPCFSNGFLPDGLLTEEISNFVNSTPFRNDVFSRSTPGSQGRVCIPDDDRFGLAWPSQTRKMQEIMLCNTPSGRIVRTLHDGPLSWRDIRRHPEMSGLDEKSQAALLRHGMATLVVTRYATLGNCRKRDEGPKTTFRQEYSEMLAATPEMLESAPFFPSRRFGGAVPVPPAIASALAASTDPARRDGSPAVRRPGVVSSRAAVLSAKEQTTPALNREIQSTWLPFLIEAGIVNDA